MKPWIGVDLDGTLAQYAGWEGPTIIGDPVPLMCVRVLRWRAEGKIVKILTARVSEPDLGVRAQIIYAIQEWCKEHLGEVLPITCEKDFGMTELWDDRAVQVIPNTGRRVDGQA